MLRCHLKTARSETEEIAQFIIHNPYPFIQLSYEGQILFANPAAYLQYSGLAGEGLEHAALAGLQELLIEKEKRDMAREVVVGDKIWYQRISPIKAVGGHALAVYCYDVSERREFERQLEESRKAAETANQAKSDFLANMSHELRTPMNGMIGLSDILMKMDLGEKPQELISAVNSSSRNLLSLLNDILDFSKIEAGELTLEVTPFDLRGVVKQVLNLQNPVAAQKDVFLGSTVDAKVPSYLMGDPARLQQILHNMVSNALKFTEKGFVRVSVTSVSMEQNMHEIQISIEDTGIGIPRDKQESVFKKFTQADASTARKYGGTGLGLAITRQLVEIMGGTIGLESQEGVGTKFSITMPLQIAEENAVVDMDQGSEISAINTQTKIMIVDDHPVNLLFMRNVLSHLGFSHVDEATGGREALNLFEKERHDLILMDCQMPDMDGYKAASLIREQEGADQMPVIIAVTADAMKGAQEKCAAAGMDDYISKPVEAEKLRCILQKWRPRAPEKQSSGNSDGDQCAVIKTLEFPESVILNWERLNEFTRGDLEQEREVVSLFTTHTEELLQALKKSLDENDHEKWEQYTHKLYGSAANLGAQALAEICDEAQNFEAQDREEKKKTLGKIKAHYQQLYSLLMKGGISERKVRI